MSSFPLILLCWLCVGVQDDVVTEDGDARVSSHWLSSVYHSVSLHYWQLTLDHFSDSDLMCREPWDGETVRHNYHLPANDNIVATQHSSLTDNLYVESRSIDF